MKPGAPFQAAADEVSAEAVRGLTPKVSVLTITYNHEPFIGECIESVMRQRTAFGFEMVIGEDASTDRTRALCREYQRRHPERIRLLLPPQNRGRHANFRHAFAACRGEYVALLEGDDYWTAPAKLQRQADLLDAHPEWALCFHNVRIEGDRQGPRPYFETAPKPVFTQEDFVERNVAPTCACMFRNRGDADFPSWYYDEARNPYTDWTLHALNTAYGDAGYLHEVMGVHRRHAGGVWGRTFDRGAQEEIERMTKRLITFERLADCMPARYQRRLRRQRALASFHLAVAYRARREWRRAASLLARAFREDPWAGIPFLRFAAAMGVQMWQRGRRGDGG